MSDAVTVNGIGIPRADFEEVVMKELDRRRRHYHVRATQANGEGARLADTSKAKRMDDVIQVLSYAVGAADPSEERLEERRRKKAAAERRGAKRRRVRVAK